MWWPWRPASAAPSSGTIPTRRANPGGFGTSRPVKLARCPGRTRNGDSPRPISCTQSWSPSLVPTQNPSSA